MKALIMAVMLAAASTPAVAQEQAARQAQGDHARQAFEHYEGVRVALANDNVEATKPHAKQLATTVEPVGGPEARKHAEALAAAKTIEEARTHFGELSVILVPRFQEANLQGAHAFTCAMAGKPWMQKGQNIENPYYGKSMLTCGSELPPKKGK